MKIVLLSLIMLSACTSSQTPAVKEEAPQKSPYSVGHCACMKIYQPVCAGGVTYGNSCEAECNGHKKWTDGGCGEKK